VIDRRFARTYLLLALLIFVAPAAGVLLSSLSRGEAGGTPPGSVIFDAPLPARTPVAPWAPPQPTPTEAAPEAAAQVSAAPAQDSGEASGGEPPVSSAAPDVADGTDATDAISATDSTDATDEPSVAARTQTPATKARGRANGKSKKATATPTEGSAGSVFDHSQVVAFYGSPISDQLGVLGSLPPDQLAQRLRDEAGIYDNLNGDRFVTAALDLIYAQAQAGPTDNGLFLDYLDDWSVKTYIALAERDDFQVILDLQIGRGNVVDEVRKIERFLVDPRVHVAIDPEYAVGPAGWPNATPGQISGDEINAVQDYLDGLVKQYNLPPKMLVIHQYLDDTVVGGDVTKRVPNVDLVLNMDGIGRPDEKLEKYHKFASEAYATHRSYNVFIQQDSPIASEAEIMALSPQPDMVIYQ